MTVYEFGDVVLEKRNVTHRLGRLTNADRTNLAMAWHPLFERLPRKV